ncbi:MAG TPA: HAD family hydrolase [Vicinamibacteria bacterium]|nr:HAD family hydrolase [Vicinamibacteria bacterium]
MRRLVLFDIDGTLLSAGGVSARAMEEALVAAFGTDGPAREYDYSGKTDPQIVRDLMREAGFADVEIDGRMAAVLADYRARLFGALRPEHVRAKPGVKAVVESLAAEHRVTLGLLTGNIEPCARAKLAPLGLNPHFPFGAYGSDHEDRYRLPTVAVSRALVHTGTSFSGKEVVIVGDSVHDVLCGRALGVRAVAVATGKTPRERLALESPDVLLADLSDVDQALAGILG